MARKPPKKTKEEKTAENYFPVDENDLKYTIEKPIKEVKESDLVKIESPKKKKPRKTTKRKKPTKQEFSPQKIELKDDSYELIITEKPQAALKIAEALGEPRKLAFQKIPFYEVDRDGKKIMVTCAVGHLFTLKQNNPGQNIPVFDISWIPNFMARKADFTKRYYDTISKLAKDASSITVATDYDIEGEVIGFNIIRFICGQHDANRMKFSTLTTKELNESYENKAPTINWGQAIAGETRHYLDWIYGINLSRALMNSIKTTGKFRIMSIGRVQGPALKLITDKEKKIQEFKSEKYWQIFITVKDEHELELKHNKDIFNKEELKKFGELKDKDIELETKKTEQIIPPNPPFNLTTLQTEAYNLYGITPSRTLQIAQSLYLASLISYPRTSSQKLPESINYREILEKIARKYNAKKLIKRNKPLEGAKTDPAHPSIYPTGNETNILPTDEKKIYDLISKRFISVFCDNAIIDNKKIEGEINELKFSTRGSAIRQKGWMEIYPSKLKEKEIPDMEGSHKIINVKEEEKKTQPPKRYSPASILSELEKKNLGTKATRANILETLYDRKYIKEKSIEATPLGISLIETLEKYSPIIIDEQLTRDFEKEMESIQEAKKDFEIKEKRVLEKVKTTITKIANQFKKHEIEIGKELLDANVHLTDQLKKENVLILCPKCKKGELAITYSKKTKRFFIACNAYPDCKTTFSLPPGTIKKTGKKCESCEFPMLMRLSRGKRPWTFCFNTECETNKKRIEEYQKKKIEKEK